MRILIVSQYFWPENFRVNDVCKGLIEKGHQVTVLTGIPNYPDGRFFAGYGIFKNLRQTYGGAQIIRVPLFPRGNGGNINLILNYLSFVFFATILGPFLCRQKYDAIFVYGLSPILMAIPAIILRKIRRIHLVLYVLDLWPESISAVGAIKSPFLLNSVKKIVQFIYAHSDRILVSSPGFVKRINDMGVSKNKIQYWPQWAEESYKIVPVDESSKECREMPTGFRMMFAGNIGSAQGFETIIKAAILLKDQKQIHWVILGDGRMKPWVKEQIQQNHLEDTVHLLGKHPVEKMPEYFALADVLLVSLKKDPIFALTLPAKIQSYMACGRPILACLDGDGARVIEESGAGMACPSDDAEALAKTVLEFYQLSPPVRIAMGVRAREYFEKHFTREHLLTELEKCLANG